MQPTIQFLNILIYLFLSYLCLFCFSLRRLAKKSAGRGMLRIIMVWIFAHAGKSVFALAVFHAMTNLSWQLFPIHGSFYDPKVFGLISFGFAVILIVIQQSMMQNQTKAA